MVRILAPAPSVNSTAPSSGDLWQQATKPIAEATPKTPIVTKKSPGIFSVLAKDAMDLGKAYTRRAQDVITAGQNVLGGHLGVGDAVNQVAGSVMGAGSDTIGAGFHAIGQGVGGAIGAVDGSGFNRGVERSDEDIQRVLAPIVKPIIPVVQNLVQSYEAFKANKISELPEEQRGAVIDQWNAVEGNIKAATEAIGFLSNFVGLEGAGAAANVGGKALESGVDAGITTAKDILKSGSQLKNEFKTAGQSYVQGIKEAPMLSGAKEIATETGQRLKRGANVLSDTMQSKAAQAALPEAERELHRVGIPPVTIDRLKNGADSVKKYASQMVGIAKDVVTKGKDSRPIEVVGDIITDIASKLAKETRATGKSIGDLRKGLRGVNVDLEPVQDKLLGYLDEARLTLTDGGKIVAEDGVPADPDVIEVLQDIYNYAGSGTHKEGQALDLLRQTLTKEFGKSGTPFSTNAQRIITDFKGTILDAISAASPEYGTLTKQYASRIEVLKNFAKKIGYKGKIENITKASLKAGEVARRMRGQASADVKDVLQALMKEAKSAGIKTEDDLASLVDFANELDSIAEITPSSGLVGGITQGINNALPRVPSGALDALGQFAGSALKAGSPKAEGRLAAILKFLGKD